MQINLYDIHGKPPTPHNTLKCVSIPRVGEGLHWDGRIWQIYQIVNRSADAELKYDVYIRAYPGNPKPTQASLPLKPEEGMPTNVLLLDLLSYITPEAPSEENWAAINALAKEIEREIPVDTCITGSSKRNGQSD